MNFGDAFAAAAGEGRAALFPYLMCGIPDEAATVALFEAMAEAGADGFEVGIPYADPLMDGPVIQEAGSLALSRGMTLGRGLDLTKRIVGVTGLPCAVMTYVNPILQAGPARFASAAAEAGAEAVIVADLPVDESAEIQAALGDAGIGLVQFAAPTTTNVRLDDVVASAHPFVYCVAEMGVTGERDGSTSRAVELVTRLRDRTSLPLVLGVGISDPEQAQAAAAIADGVIVGSAIVRRVLEASSTTAAVEAVTEFVGALAESAHR